MLNMCLQTESRDRKVKFNIQPQDSNRSDMAVLLVSDGGLARPAFSSNDGIAPSGHLCPKVV